MDGVANIIPSLWHRNTAERIAGQLVAGVSKALFKKRAVRLSALVAHEHQWAMDFWDAMSELGYERDPKFARYIADQKND
jgi:hypothetical protein